MLGAHVKASKANFPTALHTIRPAAGASCTFQVLLLCSLHAICFCTTKPCQVTRIFYGCLPCFPTKVATPEQMQGACWTPGASTHSGLQFKKTDTCVSAFWLLPWDSVCSLLSNGSFFMSSSSHCCSWLGDIGWFARGRQN